MFQYTFKIVNALLYTIRPSASFGACVLTLAAFSPRNDEFFVIIPLMTAAFFGSAFCFLANDIYDKEKDILNNKKRPIATGLIPINIAIGVTIVIGMLFLLSTWHLGAVPFILSFVFLVIASSYSYINSKTGLLANIIVGLMASGTQWGVFLLKPDHFLWISSSFLFFLTVPREVILDWLDVPGDRQSGKQSFPMNNSINHTRWLIILSLTLCTASLYFVDLKEINQISFWLYLIAILTSWGSFIPFLKNGNNTSALLSVRLSHVSFALLILALLSR